MRRLALLFGLVSALVVVPSADAFGGGGGCHTGRQEQSGTTVDIVNLCFSQTVVHVTPGGTVTWTNHDGAQHTVTGAGGEWGDYQPMTLGATFSNRFDDVGVYPYFCWLHPGMVGAVVVDAGVDLATATPVASIDEGGSSLIAWWVGGGLLLLFVLACGVYLVERARSALPRG